MNKSIYQILSKYSRENIDYAISCLDNKELTILLERFGNNLENPKLNRSLDYLYYKMVLPKIKNILEEKYVVDAIKAGKLKKDICSELGLSDDGFFCVLNRLRNLGYQLKK